MLEEFLGVRWAYAVPDLKDEIKCRWASGQPFTSRLWYELYEKDADALATVAEAPHSALVEIVVFENGGIEGHVFEFRRVAVLHGIRQRIWIAAVVHEQFVFFFKIGDLLAWNVAAERRKDGFRLQGRALHGELFKSKHDVGSQVVYSYIRNKNG